VGNFLKNHDISTRNGIGKRILFITKRNEDQFYEFRSSDYASTKRYIKYPERTRTSDTGFRKPIKPISAGFIGVPDYFFHVLIEAIIAFFPLAVFIGMSQFMRGHAFTRPFNLSEELFRLKEGDRFTNQVHSELFFMMIFLL
jgi:hypothetical protein